MNMKELPRAERPYEKLELFGEKALSNAELLAIIIKSGTKEETSVQVAQRILKLNNNYGDDSLNFMRDLSIQDLMEIKGIGKVKAIQLKAICELAIRMIKPSNYLEMKITKQSDIANMCIEEFKTEKKEFARVYFLNIKNIILNVLDIAIGGTNYVNVSIKEIIAQAVKVRSSKIIFVHNHPSGISKPSKEDIRFTDDLFNAAKIFNIDLLDHIIVSKRDYTSVYSYLQEEIEKIEKNK